MESAREAIKEMDRIVIDDSQIKCEQAWVKVEKQTYVSTHNKLLYIYLCYILPIFGTLHILFHFQVKYAFMIQVISYTGANNEQVHGAGYNKEQRIPRRPMLQMRGQGSSLGTLP